MSSHGRGQITGAMTLSPDSDCGRRRAACGSCSCEAPGLGRLQIDVPCAWGWHCPAVEEQSGGMPAQATSCCRSSGQGWCLHQGRGHVTCPPVAGAAWPRMPMPGDAERLYCTAGRACLLLPGEAGGPRARWRATCLAATDGVWRWRRQACCPHARPAIQQWPGSAHTIAGQKDQNAESMHGCCNEHSQSVDSKHF